MQHRTCGRSGLRLSHLSLGTWYNFGNPAQATHGLGDNSEVNFDNARALVRTAFDAGITHFDSADGYGGPPRGESERVLGHILKDLPRDEIIIGTKAGWGPPQVRGGGSRTHLINRCNDSLRNLGVDYIDIYTHHCPDAGTPLEETLWTLDHLVRSGKVRYTGLSSWMYHPALTMEAHRLCRENGWVQPVYHQTGYSLLDRKPEEYLLDTVAQCGMGYCAITTLAHGRLSDKYLLGIPADSRRAKTGLDQPLHPELIDQIRRFGLIAAARGQTIAQCALSWALSEDRITTILVGASRPEMLRENLAALSNTSFTADERAAIDAIFPPKQVNPHFDA